MRAGAATLQPLSAPHLSIVVLPFVNIGDDPEQDYFVDGVTESLTTDLSRIRGSFVIARNTAFSYKGTSPDVREIGRELNVRYVLEGSVQRGGNRLRVNVQLIDAESGNHLWAERFDKPVADLLDIQDEIVSRLANALDSELIEAEARRASRSPHPDAMDLYFQGRACWNKGMTPEYLAQARDFFDRALALDPGNVDAMVGMATLVATVAGSFASDDRAAQLAAAETMLNRALSMDPQYAGAHLALGAVQMFTNRAAQGIRECEHALALDRNLADAHGCIGMAKYFVGRAEETEAISGKRCGFRRATSTPIGGCCLSVSPRRSSARRRSGRLAAPEHRGQPQFSAGAFSSRGSAGAARPAGRGARGGAGRAGARSGLQRAPLSRQCVERQSGLPRRARAQL